LKRAFKLSFIVLFVLLLNACGNRRAPTGGEVDTESPVIVSIIPEQFSDITDQNIEITFSKPIDRSSIYEGERGILFYPLIDDKRFRWSDNNLIIEINEELKQDRNYFLTLSKQIRDLRRNSLEEDYLFVFHTGVLTNNRVFGNIRYEVTDDIGKEISLSLLSADSLRIFSKIISGRNYNLENIDDGDFILRAFIDKNNNRRYDRGTEPYFETAFSAVRNKEVNLFLDYYDDTKPDIQSIRAENNSLIRVTFTKPVKSIADLQITTADSLQKSLNIRDYDIIDKQLEIVTVAMDSVSYSLTLLDTRDFKNNISNELVMEYLGNNVIDDIQPAIVNSIPRNGGIVDNLTPSLIITFNKFMTVDNIDMLMINTITGEKIPIKLQRDSSRQFTVIPQKNLTNRTPYHLEIFDSSKDMSGNTLANTYVLQFLPISPDF